MSEAIKPLKCFITGIRNSQIDCILESRGFSHGLISFVIPAYGVQFRCRTEGDLIDMEFSIFFALLQFIETNLKGEKVAAVHVLSSRPEFVFAFANSNSLLKPGSTYRQMLDSHAAKLKIAIGYVPPSQNQALKSPADCPSVPQDKKVDLQLNSKDLLKGHFKPFQRGIKL